MEQNTPGHGNGLFWLAGGLVLGAAIGVFFAPKSGKETRDLIGTKANEFKTFAQNKRKLSPLLLSSLASSILYYTTLQPQLLGGLAGDAGHDFLEGQVELLGQGAAVVELRGDAHGLAVPLFHLNADGAK